VTRCSTPSRPSIWTTPTRRHKFLARGNAEYDEEVGMKRTIILASLVLFVAAVLLSGCASVNKKHAYIEQSPDAPAAAVYFIRPKMEKTKGVADKDIRITYQKQEMLDMDEGSYALVRIKPSNGELRIYSWTYFTNNIKPKQVWRGREFKFIPDRTYFIYLKQVNEEFRGIFYVPELVSLQQAKELVKRARASGAARQAPIDELTEVNMPPSSATKPLPPALPENIYKHEKYLHKVR
jgi:uncharacterized protein YceK